MYYLFPNNFAAPVPAPRMITLYYWHTLATNLSLIRMFSVLRSLCITGGCSECRYFIPQTIPWATDSFRGQSTYRQQSV